MVRNTEEIVSLVDIAVHPFLGFRLAIGIGCVGM
jgi:hypothetical protein